MSDEAIINIDADTWNPDRLRTLTWDLPSEPEAEREVPRRDAERRAPPDDDGRERHRQHAGP